MNAHPKRVLPSKKLIDDVDGDIADIFFEDDEDAVSINKIAGNEVKLIHNKHLSEDDFEVV